MHLAIFDVLIFTMLIQPYSEFKHTNTENINKLKSQLCICDLQYQEICIKLY